MNTESTQTPESLGSPLCSAVLRLSAGQSSAECPHCGGSLTKETPILKGDEPEEVMGSGGVVAMRMIDPRPKCPHCYGRFNLIISLQNA